MYCHERSRSSQDRREGGPSAVEHPLQRNEEHAAPRHASLAAEHRRLAHDAQHMRTTEDRCRGKHEHQDCQNFDHTLPTSNERNERVPKLRLFYEEPTGATTRSRRTPPREGRRR